jgi:hypothetical protein
MKLTITNATTSPSSLGSMNFDAPSGLSITSADTQAGPAGDVTLIPNGGVNGTGELQIRNLNLAAGSQATVKFSVEAPCAGGPFNWPNPATKQSNDFNGTGNDFNTPTSFFGNPSVLSGVGCYLGFLNKPAATQVGMKITDQMGSSGGPIEVGLFNGDGNPMTTCPVAAASCDGNLVASFGDLSIGGIPPGQLPQPFQLHAHSSFTPDPAPGGVDTSDPFDIEYVIADCSSGCSVTHLPLGGGNGTSLLDVNTTSDYGFVTLNPSSPPPTDPMGCEGFKSDGALGFWEADSGTTGTVGMTITLYAPMKAIQAEYGKNVGQQYIPICMGLKPVVGGVVKNCYDAGGAIGAITGGWTDELLDPITHTFTGFEYQAVCNSDGYYWGILGSRQDPIPATSPMLQSWSSGTINGTNYRALVIYTPPGWDGKGWQ